MMFTMQPQERRRSISEQPSSSGVHSANTIIPQTQESGHHICISHIPHMWSPMGQSMAHARLQDVRTRVQVRAWRAQATPEPERTRQPHLAPLPRPPPAATAAHTPQAGSRPAAASANGRGRCRPRPFRRGADRRRLQHHCAALLELAQLEVLLLMCGCAGHLQRRIEERGELLLLRRCATDSSILWACLLRTPRLPTPPTSGRQWRRPPPRVAATHRRIKLEREDSAL